jgi:O-antigen ligase
MHPNVYGLFSSIALVLLVASRNKDKFRFITLIVGLALSENRAAIFGAILVIGLLKLADIKESLSQKKGNSVRNAAVITFGAIFSAYLTFDVFLKPRSGSQDLYTGRQIIWTECIGFIEASPWLGRGPDFFQAVFGQSNTNSLIAFHCHNQFLDISLNFGILTALLLVLILAYAAKRTWNESSDYLGSVFILTLIVGLFEVPIRLFSTFQNYWVAIILLILWRAKPITGKSISENLIRKQQFSS